MQLPHQLTVPHNHSDLQPYKAEQDTGYTADIVVDIEQVGADTEHQTDMPADTAAADTVHRADKAADISNLPVQADIPVEPEADIECPADQD